MEDQMQLHVWGSGWGLPSIDTQCIQTMAYIKFSGAPVTVFECQNPWKSPNSTIPFFKHNERTLYAATDVSTYLRQKNYNCDFALTPKEAAEVIAYSQLVSEALHPALQYLCWVLESNYESTTRPCYVSRLPWIYKLWYSDRRFKKEATDLIATIYPDSKFDPETAEPYILHKAQECINLLSDKLGSNEFFLLPNSPCTLDSIIYSYLAPFLKIPLPHCPVKEYIKSTPNLERFVARISQRYFSSYTASGGEPVNASHSRTSFGSDGRPMEKRSEETKFPVRNKVLALLLGVAAMLAFAYKNGILRVEDNVQLEDETDDDDDENWD